MIDLTKLRKHIGTQKKKYYSLENNLAIPATYRLIFGKRSNGKTYGAQLRALERFCEHDCKNHAVAIVRRWMTDLTGKNGANYFSGLVADGHVERLTKGKWTNIRYYSSRWWLCKRDENGKMVTDAQPFAYAMCLNTWEHDKGPSYPDVNTIIFDEFISQGGNYLPDEFMSFMNVVSTIVRQRTDLDDFEVYLLGNTVSYACPYFREFGISNIREQPQGTIDSYVYNKTGTRIVVEYIKDRDDVECTPANKFFAFNNPKLDMITGGLWEFGSYPHLPCKYDIKDVVFRYFITYEDQIFQCNIVVKGNNVFTYIHRKTSVIKNDKTDLIYSLEYNPALNYRRNIFKPNCTAEQKIAWMYKNDRVYYQDNTVGEDIHNFLRESAQSNI